jgi:hypothetical protein
LVDFCGKKEYKYIHIGFFASDWVRFEMKYEFDDGISKLGICSPESWRMLKANVQTEAEDPP